MRRITLEEMTLVRIGTSLWTGGELKKLMRKNCSGLINMEKAVPLAVNSASNFPITSHLKQRLIEVVEKIGYELCVFLTKPYIDSDFELDTVKWTIDGLINGSETLREILRNSRKCTMSEFRFSCELFDESLIREIWSRFDEDERKIHRESDSCHVFATYWTSLLDGNLDFSDSLASFVIGFKRSQSLEANMLRHSIAVSNHAAVRYFLARLRQSDLAEFGLKKNTKSELDILRFSLKTPGDDCVSFILSFLEMPIPSEEAGQLIIDTINARLIKGVLDQALRRINMCGDIHYNIFRYLLLRLRHKWTIEVRDNLDFYALTLLSKGRMEKFEFLPDKNLKETLLRQIMYRLKCRRGLGIFVTIHWNNYTHLLSQYLDWLADSEEDKHFFSEFVSAVVDGRQYDL